MSNHKPRTKRIEVVFNNYDEYLRLMSKYKQPTSKTFDSVSYQSFYGNDTGHEVLEVPVVDLDEKTQHCKIFGCKRPVTPLPSGGYYSLCDIHKLNSRNNGSDFRGMRTAE